MKMSQDTRRVVDWLRANHGATRFEMQQALGGVHVTARMSDARAAGVEFEKVRDGKAWRFSVVEKPEQLTMPL